MNVVPLSTSMRNNLLALQNTAGLVSQTQERLSTGLRVAAAVDDPVAYFQSKSLIDRASDLNLRKDQINQGMSTVTAASNGLQGVTDIIKQLQGLIVSVRSTTSAASISDLVTQFNRLRQQIDSLTQDASYQGINLINGKGQALEVSFSDASSSYLNIQSLDARAQSIGIDAVRNIQNQFATTIPPVGLLSGRVAFDYAGSVTDTALQDGQTLQFTLAMTANVFIGSSPGIVQFSYGSLTLSIAAGGGGGAPAPSPFAGLVSASLGDVALVGSPLGNAGAATNETGSNPANNSGLPARIYFSCYLNPSSSTNTALRNAALGAGFTATQADQIVSAAIVAADTAWGSGSFSMQVYNAVTTAIGAPTTISSALSVVRSTTLNTAIAGGYTAEEATIIADAAYTAASYGNDRLTGTLNEQVATIVAKAAAASLVGATAIAAQRKAEEISGISVGGGPGAGGITGMLTDGMVLRFDITAMAEDVDPTGTQVKIEGLTAPDQTVFMRPFDGQLTLGAGMLRTASLAQKQLGSALTLVRSSTQTLGTHIALLQIRLDFSVAYIGSLVTGANKLTLADVNEESARMLALQTRQQLGIQAMSLSTGRGILQLFG